MTRKRVTQVFPWLLPLREWQRKKCFYLGMKLDGNTYAKEIDPDLLPYVVYEIGELMVNEHSGYDIQYQYNKVHNLRLAGKTVNRVLIKPHETFSLFQLMRYADKDEKYKDGLNLDNGKIVGSYGGGVCQISNMLYWIFLHTPLTIVERHAHAVESFRTTSDDVLPRGVDATINEGWLDLKVKNETNNTFQIEVTFDDKNMYGRVRSLKPVMDIYEIFNNKVVYERRNDGIYEISDVTRRKINKQTGAEVEEQLYINETQIDYELDENTVIVERRN